MKVINVTTIEEINDLGSAITIEGLGEDSFEDYLDWLDNCCGVINRIVYKIEGNVMNTLYDLHESNRYPDTNCTIASVRLEDLKSLSKLCACRFEIGARWLDNIIDNNLYRESCRKEM